MIMLYFTLVFLFLLDNEERALIGRLVKSPRSAWEFATKAT